MEREYNCPVVMGKPKVAFRETMLSPFEFSYLHKRQSGGQGQFGRVIGTIEPLEGDDNTKLQFVNKALGTAVPAQYTPGVEKGFRAFCEKGTVPQSIWGYTGDPYGVLGHKQVHLSSKIKLCLNYFPYVTKYS